jgi:hypothetical protein
VCTVVSARPRSARPSRSSGRGQRPSADHSRSMTARSSSPSDATAPPVPGITPDFSTSCRGCILRGVERMRRWYDDRGGARRGRPGP